MISAECGKGQFCMKHQGGVEVGQEGQRSDVLCGQHSFRSFQSSTFNIYATANPVTHNYHTSFSFL